MPGSKRQLEVARKSQAYKITESNFKVKRARLASPEKPTYNLPLMGLRRRVLSEGDSPMRRLLVRDYHLALFRASIKALDCDVVEIEAESKSYGSCEYPYVRDPVVVLHDKRLILSTKGNESYCSNDIIRTIKEIMPYDLMLIKSSYFEGGNVFYVPSKKVLIHGLDPGGHYGAHGSLGLMNESRKDHYKVDPVQTNQQLGKALKLYDISLCGLRLNTELMLHHAGRIHESYYYHLDCFMQILPDGRLIILNKEILSKDAQKKLLMIFGDNFIDLAYPDYLTSPVIFNFIAIPKKDSFAIIAPTLPGSVIESLTKLGLSVITPDSLDARTHRYDESLAKRVVKVLKKEGFEDPSAENLGTHLPKNTRGYFVGNGEFLSAETRDETEESYGDSLDEYYSRKRISFVYGGGGPHCFTTEIISSQPMHYLRDTVARDAKDAVSFFKKPKDESAKPRERREMDKYKCGPF